MTAQMDRRSQWLKGVLELCVLGTLRGEARYGYQIAQMLGDAGLGDIKGGTLYPVLGRLEAAGLVLTDWRPGESGPNRKYYLLTEQGAEVLDALRKQWQQFTLAVASLIEEPTKL